MQVPVVVCTLQLYNLIMLQHILHSTLPSLTQAEQVRQLTIGSFVFIIPVDVDIVVVGDDDDDDDDTTKITEITFVWG